MPFVNKENLDIIITSEIYENYLYLPLPTVNICKR